MAHRGARWCSTRTCGGDRALDFGEAIQMAMLVDGTHPVTCRPDSRKDAYGPAPPRELRRAEGIGLAGTSRCPDQFHPNGSGLNRTDGAEQNRLSTRDRFMLAYLVIREGSKWTDVFRLVPGRTVTIGRAATNQIVVKDERCSRAHAEIFSTNGQWTLRDLQSRNGTVVGDEKVTKDHTLGPGDIIRIAQCHLAFVHDLANAFPENKGAGRKRSKTPEGLDTEAERLAGPPAGAALDDELLSISDSGLLDTSGEPTLITHRRGQTRFLERQADEAPIPRVGRAATMLCRLAFELAQQSDVQNVARKALEGLFESTKVDAGAVLLTRRGQQGKPQRKDLEVIASRADRTKRDHQGSQLLDETDCERV